MAIILDGTTGVTTPSVNSSSNLISTVVSSPTSLSLKTNGTTTALTIDTSQNVGIGTTTPVAKQHIKGSGTSGQTTASLIVENISSGTFGLDITGTAGSSYARLRYGGGPGTGTNSMTGDVALIGLEGSSIGFQQIKFAPTQVASSDANTLDDYEEGTWTPNDSSGAGLSLTVNSALYVKVGRVVFISAYITYPSTASSAASQIGGLPFTASGATNQYYELLIRYQSNSTTYIGQAIGTYSFISPVAPNNFNAGPANSVFSTYGLIISGSYLASA